MVKKRKEPVERKSKIDQKKTMNEMRNERKMEENTCEQNLQDINTILDRYSVVDLENVEKNLSLVRSAMKKLKDIEKMLLDKQYRFKMILITEDTTGIFKTNTHLLSVKIMDGNKVIFHKNDQNGLYIHLDVEEIEKIKQDITDKNMMIEEHEYSDDRGHFQEKHSESKDGAISRLYEHVKQLNYSRPFQGIKD